MNATQENFLKKDDLLKEENKNDSKNNFGGRVNDYNR